ncbi:MAG TPA: VWA domain-containing protein [Terriglobales bacterium]
MFSRYLQRFPAWARFAGVLFPCLLVVIFAAWLAQGQSQSQSQTPSQPPPSDSQDSTSDSGGGPQTNVGPYAIPKKKDEPPPPPPKETPKKIEGMPDYSIHLDVPVVTVPVSVVSKDGQFISTLQKENFRVFEDGVKQNITGFTVTDAPITALMLVEFANIAPQFTMQTVYTSYAFAQSVKKNDWIAVTYYDIRPHILVDFTQDKQELFGALHQMQIPGFSETDLYDAMYDSLDRLGRVEGKKYLILVSSGYDSFSRITLDKVYKKIKDTKDVTIFPVSMGWQLRNYCELAHCSGRTRGMASMPQSGGESAAELDYLAADNQLQEFAKMTGGRFYQPRFIAENSEIFQSIAGDIRHRYEISYHPTNAKFDGSYRKLKVEVVAPDGGPLTVKDQKGKTVKYDVIAREGYTARHEVD